jgi:hypothetical protein
MIIGTLVKPSQALSATESDGNIIVEVGTGTGTTGTLTITESSGALGTFNITQKAAYRGAWGNTKIKAQIVVSGVSTSFGVVATLDPIEAPTALIITITLATTAEGVAIAKADTDVVSAINTALAGVINSGAPADWTSILLAATAGAGNFNSPHPLTSMSGGVDAADDDTANAVANVKTAIENLPAAGDKFDVTADGTGHISMVHTTPNPAVFANGGAGYASTFKCIDMITPLENTIGLPFTVVLSAGDGEDLITLAEADVELAGGVDYLPGTPAFLGRIAIDISDGKNDVYTAFEDNQTVTQTGWVKTYEKPS